MRLLQAVKQAGENITLYRTMYECVPSSFEKISISYCFLYLKSYSHFLFITAKYAMLSF